jgi:hypothetical protein
MSTFTKKDWVCLVSAEALEGFRAAQRGTWLEGRGIVAPLWRQISITATPALIHVRLGSVEEECALGGYWSGSSDAREFKFTWDDLNDYDGLSRMFEREQVVVFRKLAEMLAAIREHMVPLRLALVA